MNSEQLTELFSQNLEVNNNNDENFEVKQDTSNFDPSHFINQDILEFSNLIQYDSTSSNTINNDEEYLDSDPLVRDSATPSNENTNSPTNNICYTVFNPENEDGIAIVDTELLDTLNSIDSVNAGFLYQFFVKFNVSYFQIKYLKDFHIQTLIPVSHLGIMAEFQHKFDIWKSAEKLQMDVVINDDVDGRSKPNLIDIISSNQNLKSKINKTDLNEKETKCLLTMVRDYYINYCKNQMPCNEMERMANDIEKYFPGEESKTYFKRSLLKQKDGSYKTKVTGKLVSKWTNRAEKEAAKKKKLLEQGNADQTLTTDIPNIQNEAEQKRVQATLKYSAKKPLEMVLKDWAVCRDLRLKCLLKNRNNPEKVLSEWPTGNVLVSDSFLNVFLVT